MSDRAGLIRMTIQGDSYDVKGSVTIRPTNLSREAIEGLDGYHGTKRMPKAPGADGTLTDSGTLKLKTLQDVVDGEVFFELANGKSYMLTGATFLDQAELGVDEGEVGFSFAANQCNEY
jgi:hypothetical protein